MNLSERLEALLEEARAQGLLGEIAEALGRAAAEAGRATSDEDPGGDLAEELGLTVRHGMIGDSPGMRTVFDIIERVAPSSVPVLVLGETGSGKELVARALHDASPRAAGPFLAENCAAVPANLLESELFGHKRGSFTGAFADRAGHFVAADKGTLFLDEIGDMPLEMQSKLLRVLEDSEVRPVGSNKTIRVDVRVIAATHRDLPEMVAQKQFRADLYYRINVVQLELPPLRERVGDIEPLVRYFLARAARDSQSRGTSSTCAATRELAPEALRAFEAYSWPGNVRQLENEIERAVALGEGTIGTADLSPQVREPTSSRGE